MLFGLGMATLFVVPAGLTLATGHGSLEEGGSMKPLASSLLASTGLLLLVLVFVFTTGDTGHASGAPIASSTAQLSATAAVDDFVMLERSFTASRGPCGDDLGVPTNRVFPDGTQEAFVVPAGKALVLTDIEGEITKKYNAGWPIGSVGLLTATLTGAFANQTVRARTQINADAVSAGIATMNLHLQSGVVVDSGGSVCLRASVIYSTGVSSANVGADVRLHGYLIAR